VRAGLAPSLLVYAGADHLVKPEFGRAAAAALRASGSPVVHVELPWAEHGFDFAHGGPGGSAALGLVLRFLGAVL
jgi:acetyl esterase/lipase